MRNIKKIIALSLVAVMLFALAGCDMLVGSMGRPRIGIGSVPEADLSNIPEVDGVDFAYEIEYFNSTMLNTYVLKVGDSHTPSASVWAGRDDSCYSTDESVVYIAKNGNVFAKGRGTAYVLIKSPLNMFEVYKYIVK